MIIDFHTHIFPPTFDTDRARFVETDATFGALYADPKARISTAEDMIEVMDKDGVGQSVIMGIGWADSGVAREANDYIIDAVSRFPDRLVGFAGVNPAWGADAVGEINRCADAGLRGVGELHSDSQGFDLGDQRSMTPLMEAVEARGLIITTHSSEPVGHVYQGKGMTRPEVLWQFIRNFPEATVVCAHWGGGLPFYALMPEVRESLSNVYFDTAASPFLYTPDVFQTVAQLVGADKILMGSDYGLLRPSRLIKQVQESSLTTEDKEAILGGNAERLLGNSG
jgi:predicted TIM-barrel fold metal-dependent hydrolase